MKIGQRKTEQREIIIKVIKESPGPVTVNEIHEKCAEEGAAMGIATVYRTIKLLLNNELIAQVILPDGKARYEMAKLSHHHHFQCNECDSTYDIDIPCSLLHDLEVDDHLVENHEITLSGKCKDCRSD